MGVDAQDARAGSARMNYTEPGSETYEPKEPQPEPETHKSKLADELPNHSQYGKASEAYWYDRTDGIAAIKAKYRNGADG